MPVSSRVGLTPCFKFTKDIYELIKEYVHTQVYKHYISLTCAARPASQPSSLIFFLCLIPAQFCPLMSQAFSGVYRHYHNHTWLLARRVYLIYLLTYHSGSPEPRLLALSWSMAISLNVSAEYSPIGELYCCLFCVLEDWLSSCVLQW